MILDGLTAALFLAQPLRLGAWDAWGHAVVHLLTAAALIAAAGARAPRGGLSVPPLGRWVFLWALASVVSSYFSLFPGSAARGALTDVSGAALFFLAAGALRRSPGLKRPFIRLLAGPPFLAALFLSGWALAAGGGHPFSFLRHLYDERINGGFQNANVIAAGFVLVSPLAASLLLDKSVSRVERWVWGAGLASLLFHLFAWKSTMAVLVLAAQAAVLGAARWKARPFSKAKAALAAFALLSLVGLWGLRRRWTELSQHERLHWAAAGLRMAADHPVLGAGPGAYGEAFPGYRGGDRGDENTLYSHSVLIDLIAERGLAGTLPFLLVLAGFFRRAAARRGDCDAAVALGGFLVFNLVHVGFAVPALQAAFWGVLALFLDPAEKGETVPAAAMAAPALAAAAFLGVRTVRVYRGEEISFAAYDTLGKGDAAGAVALMGRAVRWDPASADARGLLSTAFFSAGDLAGAEREIRRAVDLSPFSPAFRYQEGLILLREENRPAASAAAERACLYNPLDGRNWFLRGRLLAEEGRRGEALAAFKEIVSLDESFYRWSKSGNLEERRRIVEAARAEISVLEAGHEPAR